jgi:hypothetical protein
LHIDSKAAPGYGRWARNTERDLIAAYIEDNPVSAGLAAKLEDRRWMGKLKHTLPAFL